ncbi:General secretion pathway protein D [hydrothermal vent metagenome]|uniref:General secretion pathway protein D n=1 Tax=hydrothermal vent metagenome TaxID=652676 RepID=A0A3B1CG64_9ZZZZ
MKVNKANRLALAVLVATAMVLLPATGRAEAQSKNSTAKTATADKNISIDFNDVDIKLFIKSMAELTGRNFIVDEKVRGKVTIISPRKVSIKEAMKVFESTLEVYGYAMIKAGDITKIIPSVEARQRGTFGAGPKQPGDKIVTRLIPLDYVKADEMVVSLRPLISTTSFITSYMGTNTLIIVDFASNVEKIVSIIRQLDIAGHEEIITVAKLTYAGAKEMAERLMKIFPRQGQQRTPGASRAGIPAGQRGKVKGAGPEPRIIADERINALIILAGRPQTERLLALIEQLDIQAPPGQGKINVYYLKNADAEELAKVLTNITKKTKQKGRARNRGQAAVQLQSHVTVTPDKSSNSLVVTASREDYKTIKEVIEKLDRRRKQVFVEALIMEITTDRKRQFGVEWRSTKDFTGKGAAVIGGLDFGNINAVAQNPLNAPQGLSIGVVDGVISFAGTDFLNLGALINALKTESGINILSTPNIMTTDNKEAEIVVAQNVPFVTGVSQNTGGSTLTSIERKNIGITLRIKPQISESDIVKLDVYQEISSISPTQLDKAQDLITFTRSVDTTVVVRDGQNIVIGGLIRDNLNDIERKVPFLGDIPLLGWLFKSQTKRKEKTNLLIFLTPHIINNDIDVARVTDRKQSIFEMTDSPKELEPAVRQRNLKPPVEKKSDTKTDNSPGLNNDNDDEDL